MKKALTIGLLAPLFAFAQMAPQEKIEQPLNPNLVKKSEGYVSFGAGPLPLLVPVFGAGFRYQEGYFGFDGSIQAGTVIAYTGLKENLSFLYYPKPNLLSQYYVGAGLSFLEFFERKHTTVVSLAPELTFGKEYTNETGDRRFFQLQVDFPSVRLNHKAGKTDLFPITILSYGICF